MKGGDEDGKSGTHVVAPETAASTPTLSPTPTPTPSPSPSPTPTPGADPDPESDPDPDGGDQHAAAEGRSAEDHRGEGLSRRRPPR